MSTTKATTNKLQLPIEALEAVLFASGKKDNRYNLRGVQIIARNGKLEANATNGCYLINVTWPGTQEERHALPDDGIILDRAHIEAFAKASDTKTRQTHGATLILDEDAATLELYGLRIEQSIVEGQYPDVTHVIPSDSDLDTRERENVIFNMEDIATVARYLKATKSPVAVEYCLGDSLSPDVLKVVRDRGDPSEIEIKFIIMPMRIQE